MNKLIPLATATALSLSAFAAEAKVSSLTEIRGYEACLHAAERSSHGLVPARHYFVEKQGDTAMYYINATRWQDGARDYVRIACETSANGQNLLSSVIEKGRFSQSTSANPALEIAQN